MTTAECYVHRCTSPGVSTGRFAGMCEADKLRAAQIVDNAQRT